MVMVERSAQERKAIHSEPNPTDRVVAEETLHQTPYASLRQVVQGTNSLYD